MISWVLSLDSAWQYYDWNLKSYFEAWQIYLCVQSGDGDLVIPRKSMNWEKKVTEVWL